MKEIVEFSQTVTYDKVDDNDRLLLEYIQGEFRECPDLPKDFLKGASVAYCIVVVKQVGAEAKQVELSGKMENVL